MSRSVRRSPFCGFTTAETERDWKAETNRKLRRASVRAMLRQDPEALVMPLKHEVKNQYSGPKDGRMRFDPERHPNLMRK
jgi:hypothetical protein